MLDAVVAAAFEDMQEAGEIGIDVAVRVVERVAHPSLRREMDYTLGLFAGEGGLDGRPVAKIGFEEAEAFALLQPGEACLLERHVVIGIEIVEADHLVTAVEQPCRRMIADKTGGAGKQDPHRASTLPLFLKPRQESHRPRMMSIGRSTGGLAVSRCG